MALIDNINNVNLVKSKRRLGTTKQIIASRWFGNEQIKVFDTCTTTVYEYGGLTESVADALVAANTVNNLANYRIQPNASGPTAWMNVPSAKGTVKFASSARVGDSRMFSVTVTEETHVCSNSNGWIEF